MGLIQRRPLTLVELAARRRNAQRSTGPRTRRGKALASLNALKHGWRARSLHRFMRSLGWRPRAILRLSQWLNLGPGEGADPLLPAVIAAWVRRWGKPAQEVRKEPRNSTNEPAISFGINRPEKLP